MKVVINKKSFHIFLKVSALLAVFSSAYFNNNGQLPVIEVDFHRKSLQVSQDPEEFYGFQQQSFELQQNNYSQPLAWMKESDVLGKYVVKSEKAGDWVIVMALKVHQCDQASGFNSCMAPAEGRS